MLVIHKIQYRFSQLTQKLRFLEPNWGKLFGIILFSLIILLLSVNIYNSFNRGIDTINKFHEEELKLQALQAENTALQNQVNTYESIDYMKIYARENLNLGEQGERLYYVDRPVDLKDIEQLPVAKQEITFQDNLGYWKKLILGL